MKGSNIDFGSRIKVHNFPRDGIFDRYSKRIYANNVLEWFVGI